MKRLLPLCVYLIAAAAGARVISYAPYTDRLCMPAVQHRGARHFALVEYPQNNNYTYGQVVLYDSKGVEEPRVVYPAGGGYGTIYAAAVREDDQQLAIFVQNGYNSAALSVDGGKLWKALSITGYDALMTPNTTRTDAGGPYVRGRYARIPIGSREIPFIIDSGVAQGVYSTAVAKQIINAKPSARRATARSCSSSPASPSARSISKPARRASWAIFRTARANTKGGSRPTAGRTSSCARASTTPTSITSATAKRRS